MKFGKTMEEKVNEEWRAYSVNYKLLKKKLPSRGDVQEFIGESVPNPNSNSNLILLSNSISNPASKSFSSSNIGCDDNTITKPNTSNKINKEDELKLAQYLNFWEFYAQSLKVVDTFLHQKMDWAIARLKHSESDVERHRQHTVQSQTPQQGNGIQPSLPRLRSALDSFADEIDTLLEFYELNFTAISKILKKYDKRTSSNVKMIKLEEVKGAYPFFSDGGNLVKGYRNRIEEIRGQVGKLEMLQNKYSVDGFSTAKPLTRKARRYAAMLEKAKYIVNAVEHDSPFFNKHKQRINPTFLASEIVRGTVLGEGEFGTVREIRALKNVKEKCPICLLHKMSSRNIPPFIPKTESTGQIHTSTSTTCQTTEPISTGESSTPAIPELLPPLSTIEGENEPQPRTIISINANNSTVINQSHKTSSFFELPDEESLKGYSSLDEESFVSDHEDEDAEEVAKRGFMAHHCLKNGNARYAVKHVKATLVGEQRIESAIDLAIEAKILSVISHPNVVRLRGIGGGSYPGHPDYFIILDRLYGTLGDQLKCWTDEVKKYKGFSNWMKRKKKSKELKSLWDTRMMFMHDIAQGMRYLHQHDMMYRDLKPENIGFDVYGYVKIFDFGLAKELKPKHRVRTDEYQASGRTGTRRYMAPEVILCKPYGKSADVYSFSILLWQVMSLETPFPYENHENHAKHVVQGCKRPHIASSWPILIKTLLYDGWSHNPRKRPNFDRICDLITKETGGRLKTEENLSDRTSRLLRFAS